MARRADQFRRSDVRLWGVVAAASAAVALFSANFSTFVPDNFLAGLHAARTAAPTLDVSDLRHQLAAVSDQQARLQARYGQVVARVTATEQSAGAAQHEVAVLEAALPRMVQTVPMHNVIDASALTGDINPRQHFSRAVASIAVPASGGVPPIIGTLPQPMPPKLAPEPIKPVPAAAIAPPAPSPQPPANAAPADGIAAIPVPAGTAALNWAFAHAARPIAPTPQNSAAAEALLTGATPPATAAVPLAPIKLAERDVAGTTANPRAIGVAVGAPVAPANAMGAWQQLASRIGVLLVGTSPLLADDPAGSTGKVLVAGPIASIAAATSLCANIRRSGINCLPMPYVGTDLPPAAAP